jgi:hypothetical protein
MSGQIQEDQEQHLAVTLNYTTTPDPDSYKIRFSEFAKVSRVELIKKFDGFKPVPRADIIDIIFGIIYSNLFSEKPNT